MHFVTAPTRLILCYWEELCPRVAAWQGLLRYAPSKVSGTPLGLAF